MTHEAPVLTARQELGTRSREEILDAAERLMGARGYAATSISALSKECGLPASSIYWHFGSKSGVLGAVMERGSRRFFAANDLSQLAMPAEPRERLAIVLRTSSEAIHEHPQFLRLFVVLLLGSEGDHAQHEVVARVRTEGALLLQRAVTFAYTPWGDETAERVGNQIGPLTLALFDGIFIAAQASGTLDSRLIDRAVGALHALAEKARAAH